MTGPHTRWTMTRPQTSAVDTWNGVDTPRPLASWYTEGVSDGVGDRLLMFDNSGTTSLELLRFRAELVAVPGFEEALRDHLSEGLAALREEAGPSGTPPPGTPSRRAA